MSIKGFGPALKIEQIEFHSILKECVSSLSDIVWDISPYFPREICNEHAENFKRAVMDMHHYYSGLRT